MTHKIKFENSPPPSDFEYDDVKNPIFFTYPFPQLVDIPPIIQIDFSLIHPDLIGSLSDLDESDKEAIDQEDDNVTENANENPKESEQKIAIETEEIELILVSEQDTAKNEAHQNQTTENSNKVEDKPTDKLQKGEHVCAAHEKKRRRHFSRILSEKQLISIDSDNDQPKYHSKKEISSVDSDNGHQRNHLQKQISPVDSDNDSIIYCSYVKGSKIEPLSKESVNIVIDQGYRKPKPRRYLKSKFSKRIPVSDDDKSSSSERPPYRYTKKSNKCQNLASTSKEKSLHSSKTYQNCLHNKKPRKSPEQVTCSEEEVYTYVKKAKRFSKRKFSESDDSSGIKSFCNNNERKCYNDDYAGSERSNPKRKVKQETKLQPVDAEDNKECCGPDIFYCKFCKLSLNSELTWSSHLLGKRHARAIRAQSVSEVAKSSLLPASFVPNFEGGRRHDKPPPGIERKELKNAVSSIQVVCDGLRDKQAVGMEHVWEIRGEAETVYYCYLCDSPCAASSVMLHITGYKHRSQCLEEYFPEIFDKYRDAPKKILDRVMDDLFYEYRRMFRKEKVRVFEEFPINHYKKSSAFPSDNSGPSSLESSQKKLETLTIKDENGKSVIPSNQEFLNTKFADFHCTVCDSHMNNIQMWEAHIRGKRHLKNLKKAPQGLEATNKYIKAPHGTVSNLERHIEEVCSDVDIIVGLNYIRENQGKHGNQYNCFPCGGCCSDIDIIDHILAMKHKIKILEKMHFDGLENNIMNINNFEISTYFRGNMVDDECIKMVQKHGPGKPQVYFLKRDLRDCEALRT